MADLLSSDVSKESDQTEAGLDEGEIEILQQAGILKTNKTSIKKRTRNHLLFVNNDEEGAVSDSICCSAFLKSCNLSEQVHRIVIQRESKR